MDHAVLHIKLITPEKIIFEGEILSVTVPTTTGAITVLPTHTPLVSSITKGELVIKTNDEEMHFAVFAGVIDIRPGSVVNILVDKGERAEEIDVVRAEQAVERARKVLEEKVHESDVDFARFEALIEKELNRVKVGSKWTK